MPSEKTKTVQSVLFKNADIRTQQLQRNKGKYSQVKEELAPAIGEYYDIRNLSSKSLTNDKDLATYTIDAQSDYSKSILQKYYKSQSARDNAEVFYVDGNVATDRWGGAYDDYRDYANYVFNKGSVVYNIINGILANSNIENALRETEVGIVDHLNVATALAGEVTTNPNLSATAKDIFTTDYSTSPLDISNESKMGLITNYMYAQSLYNGAKFNSARNVKYLTPSLFYQYGNNLANINKLSDILWIDSKTGRIRDDLGADVTIADDFSTVNENNNGGYEYLLDQLEAYNSTDFPKFADTITRQKWGMPYNGVLTSYLDNGIDSSYYEYDDTDEPLLQFNHANSRDNSTISKSQTSHRVHNDINVDIISPIGTEFDAYTVSHSYEQPNLMDKTNSLFKNKKIRTMIGRFHENSNTETSTIDTAVDATYGNAHGRALKKLNHKDAKTNGLSDPYCRSWTYHKQYSKYTDSIRPFIKNGDTPYSVEEVQEYVERYRAKPDGDILNGGKYLAANTILNNNSLVRITPSEDSVKNGLTKYMFSIENLAWVDYVNANNIEKEQWGPNGGRIMWFPPYDLDFQESVNVDWNPNKFIGRGEPVYTYSNTERSAQLSFTLLIDHPSIINELSDSDAKVGSNNEQDIDADILRFFAGCQPLVKKYKEDENNEPNKDKEPQKDAQETPPATTNEIIFPVFFPNNYSGLMNSIEKSNWEKSNNFLGDEDWAKYLLMGYNTGFDNSHIVGYEMLNNGESGISNITNADNDEIIWPCPKNIDVSKFGKFEKLCSSSTVNDTYKNEGRYFAYRVDFDLKQHSLIISGDINNYRDTISLGLNSVLSTSQSGTHGTEFQKCNYSFAEVLYALKEVGVKSFDNFDFNTLIDSSRKEAVGKLVEIFEKETFSSMEAYGCATNQDSKNSDILAKRRATNTGRWIRDLLPNKENDLTEGNITVTRLTFANSGSAGSINTKDMKTERCAIIRLGYGGAKVDSDENEIFENQVSDFDSSDNTNTATQVYTLGETYKQRYGDEYKFFKDLEASDPYIFKQIKKKYDYFNPAFHSLSPEGFNARLNFLHQCTRQGHTISASEQLSSYVTAPTAGNLAFGRQPVIVLRIGDFINTRAIIESVQIAYSNEGIQWDLNPEGAGVQPMYAKVSMGLHILGGMALNGPVNRLQNAQTFNYYANTGVYDDRADRVTINTDLSGNTSSVQSITYQKLFTPNK